VLSTVLKRTHLFPRHIVYITNTKYHKLLSYHILLLNNSTTHKSWLD
jgi:hypothetical protein